MLFRCLLELEIGSHMSSLARSFSKLIRRLSPFGHVHMSPEARSKGYIKLCQRQNCTKMLVSRHTSRFSWCRSAIYIILKKEGGIKYQHHRKVIIANYARSQSPVPTSFSSRAHSTH